MICEGFYQKCRVEEEFVKLNLIIEFVLGSFKSLQNLNQMNIVDSGRFGVA